MKKAEGGSATKGGAGLLSGKAGKIENIVAEDQNWRISVQNELKAAEQWKDDWGFLVESGDNSGKSLTKEE